MKPGDSETLARFWLSERDGGEAGSGLMSCVRSMYSFLPRFAFFFFLRPPPPPPPPPRAARDPLPLGFDEGPASA